MLQTLRNAWKTPDIRKKILFVLFILVVYRIGAVMPVPFVNAELVQAYFTSNEGSIFQYLNTLSGDAFSRATLFALSVSPYITAQIVFQLLAVAIPALERISKEEGGRKKIENWTRILTVVLAFVTSFGYYMILRNNGYLTSTGRTTLGAIVIIVCYCAGASLIMWLAEKINENGIGNGISLILFANIISSLPTKFINGIGNTVNAFGEGAGDGVKALLLMLGGILLLLVAVTFVVFITGSERRIPVQYAKRVVGRKMYGGQNTNLPIKLNMTGVMPIIFASSIVSIPSTIISFFSPAATSFWGRVNTFLSYTSPFYAILFFLLIIAFSYFYIQISFNPVEVSNNLKKNGGFIPGIRPGRTTAEYISKILSKVTLLGALFLGVVAVGPLVINMCASNLLSSWAFGGSSLLLVVGVAQETARELEAQLSMRNYKGFLS